MLTNTWICMRVCNALVTRFANLVLVEIIGIYYGKMTIFFNVMEKIGTLSTNIVHGIYFSISSLRLREK